MNASERATAEMAGRACPYCRFPLKEGEAAATCPSCRSTHHAECWRDNGGCAVVGCGATAVGPAHPPAAAPPPYAPPPAPGPYAPPAAPPERWLTRERLTWLITGLAVVIIAASVLAVLLLGPSDDGGADTSSAGDQSSGEPGPATGAPSGTVVAGNTLTIYSSLPLQGPSRVNSESVNKGAQLALDQRGGRVGNFTIEFVELDDATPQAGKWDPGSTLQNARLAVQDQTTIAYIGEFNSGASANSMPILNKAGILQVSPSNTAVGLTASEPAEALEAGEPDKYYPTGSRHYGRITPNDNVQAAAIAADMGDQGCSDVFVVNDGETYSAGLAEAFGQAAGAEQLSIAGNTSYDPAAAGYRSLASRVRRSGADCFLGSLIVDNNGMQLFTDVAAVNPQLKLWGPDGVAETTFTDPDEGGVSSEIGARMRVTVATLAPEAYPAPGQRFFEGFEQAHGEEPEPYAIYGYEAMSVILDAIERAGPNGNARGSVIEQFFRTQNRSGAIGTYSIDENGDTSLRDYGIYTIRDGLLEFEAKVTAGAG